MIAGFAAGAWGADPNDATTLSRFIQRPSNRDCTDQIAAIIVALVDARECLVRHDIVEKWPYEEIVLDQVDAALATARGDACL